jgi:hypothetical protein
MVASFIYPGPMPDPPILAMCVTVITSLFVAAFGSMGLSAGIWFRRWWRRGDVHPARPRVCFLAGCLYSIIVLGVPTALEAMSVQIVGTIAERIVLAAMVLVPSFVLWWLARPGANVAEQP